VKNSKKLMTVIAFIALLSPMALANGLNLNSLGTKALTMGGAFVGLADDFSTIYWNPAGIAHFSKKYFGFYGTDIIPSGTYQFGLVDAKTVNTHYLGGMITYYHPVNEKVVAGIAVYIPSGLGNKWDGADFALVANNNPNLEWKSKIGLVTIAPALAFKINEQISVGVALNINYGIFDIAMHAGSTEIPIPPYAVDLGQYQENMKGWGYGATVGVLVKPNETFSFGATIRTPSKVKFTGDAIISGLSLLGISTTSDLEREVTWPIWIAGGVAYKPTNNLTLTGDIQWTQWSKIELIETDFKDIFWQIMMAESGDDKRPMHWMDTTQIRFGAEYRINAIAIRGGYYWDPSPAPDKTMNVLLPNYDFNVFTLGFGYELDGLQVDLGLEYLMGSERNIPFEKVLIDPDWETAMPGLHSLNIIVPNLSISYKF